MKRTLSFLVFLLYYGHFSYSQEKCQSISAKIKKLNWCSFHVVQQYVLWIKLEKEASDLILCSTKKTVKKLLHEIDNPQKTVIIHVILSKMFEKNKSGVIYFAPLSNDSSIDIKYSYNNISWTCDEQGENCTISKDEILRAKTHWQLFLSTYK